ncbi:MAG: class I SAM-dependent methyltransferase [Bacteroidota bacterium]
MFKEILHRLQGRIPTLASHAAYELWAGTYGEQQNNIFLQAEERALLPLLDEHPLTDQSVLDAGCGTGRHIRHCLDRHAMRIVGIDFSRAMLHRGAWASERHPVSLVEGSVEMLPLRDSSFDLVLVPLVLGHVRNLRPAAAELTRVLKSGGRLLISDWHPANERRGWKRVFEVPRGEGRSARVAVEHHFHETEEYLRCFESEGFLLEERIEPVIDESMRQAFENNGMEKIYAKHLGSPLVLVLGFRKP